MSDPGAGQRMGDGIVVRRPGHGHQALDGEGQGVVDGQALRHIADAQGRGALDPASIGPQQAEHDLGRGRLAATVGAD